MYTEYFKEIFQSSKTVIVPGLGSFTQSTPGAKIGFNPYLKFNDGFLAGFIAKKQGISIEEAGKAIGENVEKINAALQQKGEAMVLGLGTLKKSADGKIEFIPGEVTATNPVQEVKTPEVKPAVVPEVPKIPVPEIKKPDPVVPVVPSPPKLPDPPKPEVKPIEPPKKEEPKKEPEGKKTIEPVKNDSGPVKVVAPTLTNVSENSQTKKDKNAEKATSVNDKTAKEKKKRKFPIWLMIVIILIGGGGTFAAINWDMVKGWFGASTQKEQTAKADKNKESENKEKEEVATTPTEETPADSIPQEEPAEVPAEIEKTQPVKEEVKSTPVPVNNTPPVSNTVNGNFHVICGNFSDQNNANNMVSKLSAEGHQAVNLGLRGNFYMVSAGSFSTQQEALSKLEALKSTHPKAYIYNGL